MHSEDSLRIGTISPHLQKFDYIKPKMGTGFRIVLYASDQKTADEASAAAFARIDQLNAILSDYDPESELSRLSRRTLDGPMAAPIPVSEDLYRILEQSLIAARRSEGAFDVTIGPCVKLWRRARDMSTLPTPERLAEARQSVGSRFIKLDPDARAAQLLHAKMRLDVGGIAKGYAAQEALATLRNLGVTRALVGAAGDLAVGDPPPGREHWRVAIESLPTTGPATQLTSPQNQHLEEIDPLTDFGSAYVRLSRYAVSTSGDTERFVIIGGQRYSHIIDPDTGLGLTNRIGVTVVAADGMTADWMALAVSVLGASKGLALVERTPGAAARVVTFEGGGVSVFESKNFHDYSDPAPDPAPPSTTSASTTFSSSGSRIH